MIQVFEDEVLFLRFTVGGCDARVEFEDDVFVGADGLGADVEGFADAEAGAEEGCVGCAKERGAVEDWGGEGIADDGFDGEGCCGFEVFCRMVSSSLEELSLLKEGVMWHVRLPIKPTEKLSLCLG